MADLPTVTDHLNDVEIAANAPITETLNRRYGSNINFLLEFLGITDGSTSPGAGGSLADFFNAVNLVSAHTISLQATMSGSGFTPIGTYNLIPFVDHVFFLKENDTGAVNGHTQSGGSDFKLFKQINGAGRVAFNAARNTPASLSPTGITSLGNVFTTDIIEEGALPDITKSFADVRSAYIDGGLGIIGYENVMRASVWTELGTLSYREISTNAIIDATSATAAGYEVWLGYRLNLQSAPLLD